jgi:glycosyltransferase involved in cell wall biosynthesis
MRIGIDYTAAAHQGAGIGRYTRALVRALTRLDRANEYRLFVAGGGGLHAQAEWPANVQLRTIPLSQRNFTRIWHRLRIPLPVEVFTGPLDLFYSPDFVLPPLLSGRTLLTVHDLSFVRYPQTADPRLYRYLNVTVPRSMRRADHILADSRNTARDLTDLWDVPPGKVSVLYPGVEPRFHPLTDMAELSRVRNQYGLPPHFILSVSTLQPRKNYERLIRAFSKLQATAEGHPVRLVVAGGKGWLYDSIFDSVRDLGLEERVLFPGFVHDGDLPALYTLADLFAFPSLYEGFGLPALEAMSCGTPVVCSDASSLPEVVGDAGLLVDPVDEEGWVEAMGRALGDEQLRRGLVARGLARARRFTWEEAARELHRLCTSLVG